MRQDVKQAMSKPIPAYHPVTRWLHAGLVLGVIFQLVCAAQMTHPEHAAGGHNEAMKHTETPMPHHSEHADSSMTVTHTEPVIIETAQQTMHKDDALGQWFMSAHRTAGILVALIVLANLFWAVIARGKPRKRQIAVLFSTQHWAESGLILKHLPSMIVGKRALPEPGNSLSLIVEMLGLLTMTAMAVTGSVVWALWAGSGNIVSESAELWMGIHAGVAILLLLYLVGHVSMALLHMRSGDAVFARIVPWGKKNIITE